MRAIKYPEVIHLRRMSAKRGILVTECTRVRIPENTRLRFANLPSGATCPACIASRAAKDRQEGVETVLDSREW